jgi:hypothetical protein
MDVGGSMTENLEDLMGLSLMLEAQEAEVSIHELNV